MSVHSAKEPIALRARVGAFGCAVYVGINLLLAALFVYVGVICIDNGNAAIAILFFIAHGLTLLITAQWINEYQKRKV